MRQQLVRLFLLFLLAFWSAQTAAQDLFPVYRSDECQRESMTVWALFNPGSGTLASGGKRAVQSLLDREGGRTGPFLLRGFVDARERNTLGDDLAFQRARSVRDFLIESGINPAEIWINDHQDPGSTSPLFDHEQSVQVMNVNVGEQCQRRLARSRVGWIRRNCLSAEASNKRECQYAFRILGGE